LAALKNIEIFGNTVNQNNAIYGADDTDNQKKYVSLAEETEKSPEKRCYNIHCNTSYGVRNQFAMIILSLYVTMCKYRAKQGL